MAAASVEKKLWWGGKVLSSERKKSNTGKQLAEALARDISPLGRGLINLQTHRDCHQSRFGPLPVRADETRVNIARGACQSLFYRNHALPRIIFPGRVNGSLYVFDI